MHGGGHEPRRRQRGRWSLDCDGHGLSCDLRRGRLAYCRRPANWFEPKRVKGRKPPMARHPVLTILMVVFGVILLLPGVCAVVFIVGMGTSGTESGFVLLWAVCLLIAFGGVMLILPAFRSPPPSPLGVLNARPTPTPHPSSRTLSV